MHSTTWKPDLQKRKTMQFYTVHEPPEPSADRIDRAGSLVFVSDRFTPLAVVFGPLWLLANRLWYAFGIYLLALAAVALVIVASGLSWRWISLMVSAFNLFLGFEAASLQRWGMETRGWRMLGTVSGRTLDECERRFLETYLNDQRLAAENASRSASMASSANAPSGSGHRLAGAATGNDLGGRLGPAGRSWLPWRSRTSAT